MSVKLNLGSGKASVLEPGVGGGLVILFLLRIR